MASVLEMEMKHSSHHPPSALSSSTCTCKPESQKALAEISYASQSTQIPRNILSLGGYIPPIVQGALISRARGDPTVRGRPDQRCSHVLRFLRNCRHDLQSRVARIALCYGHVKTLKLLDEGAQEGGCMLCKIGYFWILGDILSSEQ